MENNKINKLTLSELFIEFIGDYENIRELFEKDMEDGFIFFALMNDDNYISVEKRINPRSNIFSKKRTSHHISYSNEDFSFVINKEEYDNLYTLFLRAVKKLESYKTNKKADEIIGKLRDYKNKWKKGSK